MRERKRRSRLTLVLLFVAILVLAWLVSRSGWFPASAEHRVLAIYCYSSLDEVMTRGIFPAFRDAWQRRTAEKLEFVPTFSGSGEITDRILRRYPAEIAVVSSELDAYRLPIPFEAWKNLPQRGFLARTPLVIVTRPGNPHGIEDFADLKNPELSLIHGDPVTSGAANLSITTVYSHALRASGDPELALQALADYWRNVSIEVPSAHAARLQFERGEGDAFVTYEQDVVANPSRDALEGEIVMPLGTLMVEPIVARIDKNITPKQKPLIDAFLEFLWSPEGQAILVDFGFHSVVEELGLTNPRLGSPEGAVTLADLGGAKAVERDILDAVWRKRVSAPAD